MTQPTECSSIERVLDFIERDSTSAETAMIRCAEARSLSIGYMHDWALSHIVRREMVRRWRETIAKDETARNAAKTAEQSSKTEEAV